MKKRLKITVTAEFFRDVETVEAGQAKYVAGFGSMEDGSFAGVPDTLSDTRAEAETALCNLYHGMFSDFHGMLAASLPDTFGHDRHVYTTVEIFTPIDLDEGVQP